MLRRGCKANTELRRVADEYSSYEVTDPADRLRALAEDIEADATEFDVTTPHEAASRRVQAGL